MAEPILDYLRKALLLSQGGPQALQAVWPQATPLGPGGSISPDTARPGGLSDLRASPEVLSSRIPAVWDDTGLGEFFHNLGRPFTPSGHKAPVWNQESGLGNIPGAIVNANPISTTARTVEGVGGALIDAGKEAYRWGTTPEDQPLLDAAQKAAGAAAPPPPAAVVTPAGTPTGTQPNAGPASDGYTANSLSRQHVSLSPVHAAIAQRLQNAGYSPGAIAGALGSITQESSGRTGIIGDQGASYGGLQWQKGRRVALERMAADRGVSASDPNVQADFFMSELQGPEGYAQQQLAAARTPEEGAAAMLHYLRPQGYSRAPGQFNPAHVHGWANRVNYSNEFANLLASHPLPFEETPYQAGEPPKVPGYVDQPTAQAPDYSESNSWWEKAAPQRYETPEQQKNDRIGAILQGMAAGAAGTDLTRSGAVGKLFANVGAGALAGRASARADERAAEQDYGRRSQGYAASRAGVAGQRAETTATYGNAAAETRRANVVGKQGTDYNQATQDYTVGEANRATKFKADEANREALTQWSNSIGVPQILGTPSDKGFWTNTPGTGIEFHSAPAQQNDIFKSFGKPKLPDAVGDVMRYKMVAALGKEPLKSEVLKDIVKSGQAPRVMPPELVAEATALADSDKSLQMLMGTTGYSAARDEIISNYLEEKLRGNDGWVPSAAAIGNAGAQMLVGQ